jgi:hypothetical protein
MIKDVIIHQGQKGLAEVLFNPTVLLSPTTFLDNFRFADHWEGIPITVSASRQTDWRAWRAKRIYI